MTEIAERWPLAELVDVRDALLAAYREPRRSYHVTLLLAEILEPLAGRA